MPVFASVHSRGQFGAVGAIASQASAGIALASISSLALGSAFTPAQAQTVTTDGTLPTTVIQDAAASQFTVTGGSAQRSNLFHSFDAFSPADYSVVFDLSADAFGSQIERIFSRVTGTSPSDINGSLSILGGNAPDLFLLNPNGIIFGSNARLDLPGSFVGTSAESVQFQDGASFGTADKLSPSSLLSISIPKGLQLGQNPGAIVVLGNGHHISDTSEFLPTLQDPNVPASGLSVTPGNLLALIGGPVRFEGAELQSLYQTLPTGDSIPLGGLQLEVAAAEAGLVQFEERARGWQFDYSDIDQYQDIALTQRSWLNAGGLMPGRINLTGRNITLDSGSAITINNFFEAPEGNLSGVNIRASELLKLQGTPQLRSWIRTTTTAQTLEAGAQPDTRQNAGPVNIWSKNLQVLDGAYINSTTFGSGSSGLLTVAVQGDSTINGQTDPTRPNPNRTFISATTLAQNPQASGDANNISISSDNLLLTNGGAIASASIGPGDAGLVDIDVTGRVTVQEFNPVAQFNSNISAVSLGAGDSGEGVFIRARQLDVLDGGRINSSNFGSGDTGAIQLDILESIRVGGVDSATSTEFAAIDASIRFDLVAANALIQDQVNQNFGDVRNIKIQTPKLELFDRGTISVVHQGEGNAGDIKIETGNLLLSDQAKIIATTQTGRGGSIKLMADEFLLLRRGSEISVSSQLQDSNANDRSIVSIKTPHLVAFPQENSDITADATAPTSTGGTVKIEASSILGLSVQPQTTDRSDITASSGSEALSSGRIELSQPNADVASGITALPSRLSGQDTNPIANYCNSNSTQLARKGRGGLPLGPNNLLHDTLFVQGENDPINQAIALRNQGFYSQALTLLQKDIASPQTENAPERQAIALRQLGITHKLLEQHPESRATLEQSLAISQRLNLPEQTSATLLSLGNLTRAKDKIEAARRYYQQALDENPDPTLKHQILANQLSLEVALGESNDAVKRIAQKLLDELAGEIRGPLHLETRLNVAATLLSNRKLDIFPNFLTVLEQDLVGAQKIQDPAAIAYALGHLSKAYEQTGDWQNAQRFAEAALNKAQVQQDQFQEYRWAWQLGRVTRARWEASGDEQWRSQSQTAYKIALNALQQLRGDLATVSPALQFSFRNRVEPVYREYVDLLLASDDSQAQPTSANLSQALETIESLRLAELDNFFQDACLNSRPQSIQQLDAKAVVVYPILLDDRLEVIISHQGRLQQHSIPVSSQELESTVRRFQQGLVTRSRRSHKQPGQQLYDWLIRPLLADLEAAQIETLVFVPDGPLANVPMAALFDGEAFLVEQFKVAVTPSLQLLPAKRTSAIPTQSLVAGITRETQDFAPLPHVEWEVEQVQALFPGERLLNESFTREALGKLLVESQPPIVHVATHGQFSSKASETFILAWDEQISIEQLHELLKSRDRQSLSPTELLVLSACETAAGDEFAALGLAGMAVRAGARSTLASLWAVNDQSTSALMEAFYQQLSQPGATKSGALRDAQLAMLNDPIHQHPYYWSAFVLMGSWQ